jgi:hypothetical protein
MPEYVALLGPQNFATPKLENPQVTVTVTPPGSYFYQDITVVGGLLPDLAGLISGLNSGSVIVDDTFAAEFPDLDWRYFRDALATVSFAAAYQNAAVHTRTVPSQYVLSPSDKITIQFNAVVGDINVRNLSAPTSAVVSIVVN